MKKFKKLLAVVFAFCIIVTATGCTITTETVIGTNSKATVNVEIKVSKAEIDSIASKLESKSSDLEDMLKESGAVKTNENGVIYYTLSEKNTSTLEEINQTASAGTVGNYTTTDVWAYSDTSMAVLGIDTLSSVDMLKQMGVSLQVSTTIKMPYKITKTNLPKIDDYTVVEECSLDNLGSNISYIITEKSTATWTKAENIEAEILKMAKPAIAEQLNSSIFIMAGYKNKTSLLADVSAPYCTGGTIEYKVGNGKFKALKSFTVKKSTTEDLINGVASVDNFSATLKNVKAGKKYTFRVVGYYDSKDLGRIYSSAKKDSIKTINFNKISVKKLSSGKKSFTVKIKSSDSPDAYQVQYSKNKNFKGAKTKTVYMKKATVKKLKSGTKYYVRVRKTVVSSSVKTLKGNWSKAKTVTVK